MMRASSENCSKFSESYPIQMDSFLPPSDFALTEGSLEFDMMLGMPLWRVDAGRAKYGEAVAI